MYQNQNATSLPTAQPEQEPRFHIVNNRFDGELTRMSQFVYDIESKLHDIYNKRSPEKTSDNPKEKSINDFNQAMFEKLESFSVLNDRLAKVLSHLCEII